MPSYTAEEAAEATREAQQAFLRRFEVSSAQELEQQMINKVTDQANREITKGWGPQTVPEYLKEHWETTDVKVAAAHYLLDLSTEATRVQSQFSSGEAKATATVEKVVQALNADIEQEQQGKVDEAAAVPLWERMAGSLGLDDARSKGELNEADPEEGSYFSEDLTQVTLVQDCAASATDDDSASDLRFPTSTDDGIETFAEFGLAVMKSGELSITQSEVEGFMLDSNGDWIAR